MPAIHPSVWLVPWILQSHSGSKWKLSNSKAAWLVHETQRPWKGACAFTTRQQAPAGLTMLWAAQPSMHVSMQCKGVESLSQRKGNSVWMGPNTYLEYKQALKALHLACLCVGFGAGIFDCFWSYLTWHIAQVVS
jgi:hypothetical protein